MLRRMSPVVSLARELVAIPSVSRDSNRDIADRCERELTARGFDCERIVYVDAAGEEKVSVAAVRDGSGDGLAYFGHSDVVPADNWNGPGSPFSPTIQQERLYGRGSCDMKGSVAAFLTAAEATTSGPVWVALTSDEETGFGGARAVAKQSAIYRDLLARQPAAIIGEPTERRVLNGHKGGVVWTLVAEGTQGHSSFGTDASATLRLLPVLDVVREIVAELQTDDAYHDDRFTPPGTTPNLRLTDSSPALNVTSAEATARLFVRLMPDVDVTTLSERLRKAAESHGVEFRSSPVWPAFYRDPQSPFVQRMCELTGSQPATAAYGTDAAVFRNVERTIVCGPGSIEQAHTTDEFIELSELEQGVTLYRRLLAEFADGR